MGECGLCKRKAPDISRALGLCLNCIREHPAEALQIAGEVHARSRTVYGLPATAPRDPGGIPCNLCANHCRIAENGLGYCGLRRHTGHRLAGSIATRAKLSWYYDPLPTNCVATWVCAGGTGAGHPRFANCRGAERGYRNLSVFFIGCSFNCLYCQNWHFRDDLFRSETCTAEQLVSRVDERTSCICYFGGDPSPQLPFSIHAARRAVAVNPDRILRLCWETNGSMHSGLLEQIMGLAIDSGGCVKFDLKAWDDNLHRALTGVSNQRTLENFDRASRSVGRRAVPPPVVASTLLVPGYIDEQEIAGIARFIARCQPDIPYSLLAFHPQFYMADLPLTSRKLADRCYQTARDAGLTRVRLGNIHLLV
jgi:pyruvate formate lyase activating enzyme